MWGEGRRPADTGKATGRQATALAAATALTRAPTTGAAPGVAWAHATQASPTSSAAPAAHNKNNNSKQRLFVPRSKNKNHKADSPHQHSHSHSLSHSTLPSHLHKTHSHHYGNSLSALGITTTDVTYKYRIHRGKTVLASDYPEDPLYTASCEYHSSSASSPDLVPPPRNPRRLQQLRYQTAVAPSRSSSHYSADDSDPESDASPTTIRCGASALDMVQIMATQPVSPPSSPEIAAWRFDPHSDAVSPIDEESDVSLDEFVKAINGPSRHPTPPVNVQQQSRIPARERDLPALPIDEPPRGTLAIEQAPSYRQAPFQRKPVSVPGPHWQTQPQRTRVQPRAQPQRMAPQAMIPERDSSFGQRAKHAVMRDVPQQGRPPWKGASGREQQVAAMYDDLAVAPLSLPAKSDKRTALKGEGHFRARLSQMGSPRVDGPSSTSTAMRKLLTSRTHKKASSLATPSPRSQYNIDGGRQSPSPYPSPPHYDDRQMTSISPSLADYPSPNSAIRRKPPPNAHVHKNSSHAHPLTSSPVDQTEIPQPPTPDSPPAIQNTGGDAWTQPTSRFSITTYATTNAGTPNLNSLQNSPAIGTNSPSPSLPSNTGLAIKGDRLESHFGAPFSGTSTLTVEQSMASADKDTMDSSRNVSNRGTEATRRSSIGALSKPLPPVPQVAVATDRISLLNAQLEGLANRRQNINYYIKQMTDLTPRELLLASADVQRKRELEKKNIEKLKEELSEIQREEHELGLLLHRAYKRQNKNAEYEPTTLWVRRVAG